MLNSILSSLTKAKVISLVTYLFQVAIVVSAFLTYNEVANIIPVETAMELALATYLVRETMYTVLDLLDDGLLNRSFVRPEIRNEENKPL